MVDQIDRRRDGPDAYDDLVPDLRRHAESKPGAPGRDARRDRLITEFLPLVRNLSHRYAGRIPAEDLEQAGVIGLIKAIDRYDPDASTGGPLAYLVPSVRGEILRHLRDHSWSMRVPRALKELSVGVNRATVTLTQRLGRAPRPSELATELGVPVVEVVETLGAMDSHRASSLDETDPDSGFGPADRLGADDPALAVIDHRGDLRRIVSELPERERTILLLRFYGEHTQSQIAERVGVSQMHVSRLLTRTLAELRVRMVADADEG